jgi:glycosyltransferase involved in cell wall biosynthesis
VKTVSLALIAKNEEAHIKNCLHSVQNAVDEMIVVDTGSTDNTKQFAMECGAKVYDFPWTNSFADARNYALQQASSDWILVLDADETLEARSAELIREFITGSPAIGRVNIVSKYLDNGEVRYDCSPISRLFPKGVTYTGRIHEQVISSLPHRMTGITVAHEGYFQTDKTERNLSLLMKELDEEPNNPYLLMQTAREYRNRHDYHTANQLFSRSYQYATKEEGYYPKLIVDYVYSMMKIGQLDEGYIVIKAEEERLAFFPDFHFLLGMFYMDYVLGDIAARVEKLPNIETSFLKCMELGERKELGGVVGAGSFLAAYNLGVYYEVIGDSGKALKYYRLSSDQGYQKAMDRLRLLK